MFQPLTNDQHSQALLKTNQFVLHAISQLTKNNAEPPNLETLVIDHRLTPGMSDFSVIFVTQKTPAATAPKPALLLLLVNRDEASDDPIYDLTTLWTEQLKRVVIARIKTHHQFSEQDIKFTGLILVPSNIWSSATAYHELTAVQILTKLNIPYVNSHSNPSENFLPETTAGQIDQINSATWHLLTEGFKEGYTPWPLSQSPIRVCIYNHKRENDSLFNSFLLVYREFDRSELSDISVLPIMISEGVVRPENYPDGLVPGCDYGDNAENTLKSFFAEHKALCGRPMNLLKPISLPANFTEIAEQPSRGKRHFAGQIFDRLVVPKTKQHPTMEDTNVNPGFLSRKDDSRTDEQKELQNLAYAFVLRHEEVKIRLKDLVDKGAISVVQSAELLESLKVPHAAVMAAYNTKCYGESPSGYLDSLSPAQRRQVLDYRIDPLIKAYDEVIGPILSLFETLESYLKSANFQALDKERQLRLETQHRFIDLRAALTQLHDAAFLPRKLTMLYINKCDLYAEMAEASFQKKFGESITAVGGVYLELVNKYTFEEVSQIVEAFYAGGILFVDYAKSCQ